MFKKTLAAVAVLGAFAGSAMAANVTLYGIVDEALQYSYVKANGGEKQDTYGIRSGNQNGSRWGVKGQEELGNGLIAGFQLESGFSADDGKLGQNNRLFGRVASMYLKGGFGTLAAGRDGGLASGLGTVSFLYNYVALGTGWGAYAGSNSLFNFSYRDRADNTLTYVTPDFGGVKVYAQYSFQADGQELPDSGDNTRYAALGVNYTGGAFNTGLVVDQLFKPTDADDQFTVSYGANYDFGAAKVYGMAQYGKHMDNVVNYKFTHEKTTYLGLGVGDYTGYNVGLGVSAPVAGGTFYAQANYVYGKDKTEGADAKVDGYGVGLAYSYPLSKRTSVYTYGAYNQFKTKGVNSIVEDGAKTKIGEVGLGLTHKF